MFTSLSIQFAQAAWVQSFGVPVWLRCAWHGMACDSHMGFGPHAQSLTAGQSSSLLLLCRRRMLSEARLKGRAVQNAAHTACSRVASWLGASWRSRTGKLCMKPQRVTCGKGVGGRGVVWAEGQPGRFGALR